MTRFVNAAWRMTQTHKTSRRLAFHWCFTLTRPIRPILGMHQPGQYTCSLAVNPNMFGLCPPFLLVTISHIYHQCVILNTFTLSSDVFISYQTKFKISTRNDIKQLQWPPPLHIARGSLCTWYSPYSLTTDSLMLINMGLFLTVETVIAADYSHAF